jgi:uncharacterized membrane protein YdjX (TVP38/TMEM64 family)
VPVSPVDTIVVNLHNDTMVVISRGASLKFQHRGSRHGYGDGGATGEQHRNRGRRSGLIVIGVLAFVLASCARIPTAKEANDAVLTLRDYEGWAWAVGIALIWADVVLPIPQTAVIAALGIIYGTLVGGLLGSLALITSGLLGYALMLTSSRRFVQRFAGPQSLRKMEIVFGRRGAWAIVLTRSLPYSVPEAMVFLAGLAGMPIRKFTAAVTIGSVPAAFAFAAIGAGWADQPILALVVSYVLPLLLLPVAFYLMRLRAQ